MTCLLGVGDIAIPSSYPTCSQTNKIGGSPNWPGFTVLSVPNCQECKRLQSLIVQLYCCLDKSRYHRTLYIFACTNASCWNTEQSWTVYRCQSEDNSFQQPPLTQDYTKPWSNTSKCPYVNDWGVDDWGVAANDWGAGADDWGSGDDAVGITTDDGNDAAKDRDVINGTCDADVDTKRNSESTERCENEDLWTSLTDAVEDCTDLQQLCIDDVTDYNIAEEKHTVTSHVLREEVPAMSEQEKFNKRQTFQVSSSADSSKDKVLTSYFINVFEEPAHHIEDNNHVSKLLKDYQNREGCNVTEMMQNTRFDSKMEKYESSTLLHKDIVFYKFMKRLSVYPEQCVRYQWNGSPLFNGYPSSGLASTCGYCGGDIVFELQLTPALINHLKFPEETEHAIEFGTVLVYTCKQSCWDSSLSYRTEYVVVQPDPDQHLFK